MTEFKYRAFISYSHGADGNIAPQLHRALSRFARPWRKIVWDRAARDFDWAKTTALPATLGGVFPDEPLYSDLRDSRTAADLSLRNPDFMNRVARIAATLHGRSLDELIESDANTGPKAQPFVDEAESPDRTLVLRQTGAGLHVADLRTGTAMASWTHHADVVASAAFSPDGVLVASVDEGGDGYVWDARTGQLRHAFRSPVPGNGFSSVVWSPDGRLLAAGAGREVQVRETGKWQQIAMLDEHSGSVDQIAFSRDGMLLATGSTMVYPGGEAADRTVHVWDARTGRVLQELTDPRRELDDVGFSADGMQVVVSYGDGTVRISDAMSGEEIALRSSSGVRVAPGLDQPVRTIMAAVVKLQDDYQNGIANLGFTADGRFLVAVDKEGAVRMWRRPTLVQHPVEPGAANIDGVAASNQRSVTSPDGHVAIELVTEAGAGTAIIVDRTHAVTVGTLSRSAEGPVAAAFSPDGPLIAIADGSEDVRIYRWESLAPLDDLIALARARAGRELRPVERAQFVPPTFGQLLRRWLVPST